MRRLSLLFFLFPHFVFAQTTPPKPSCTGNYFRYVIETLADDSMAGRLPGTAQEKKAADFIAAELKRAGCTNTTFQPFMYSGPDSAKVNSTGNVIGKIETKAKDCIVISAHYDHIGNGKFHSLDPYSHQIHNGADDNASGVAMMLGLAGWCHDLRKSLKCDIVFVAFSGEEDGLYGSKLFVGSTLIDTARVACCLNFDMVGRLDKMRPLLQLDGAKDFAGWDSVLPPDSTISFTAQRRSYMVVGGSDHASFIDVRIPAVLISTGTCADYHRPTDDTSRINYPGMEAIAVYVGQLIPSVMERHCLFMRCGK